MMNRRTFLAGAAATLATAPLLGASPLRLPKSGTRLTIVHTNDVHSHLEPKASGDHQGLGGAAGRSAFLKQLRATEELVLYLDSGDTIQGTPYFNLFKGEPEMLAMNRLGCTASTIGNHEFDGGIERLAELMGIAAFPFLNCNYGLDNTPLKGLSRESLVIEQEGLRIGLLGVGIKLDGLVPKNLYADTVYRDPIADAKRVAEKLRNEDRCDFIIALSHINLYARKEPTDEPGDRDLIRDVPEIDLVLGGHNHILLPSPEVLWRGNDHGVGYVMQSGWAGTHMGVLQFDIYGAGRRELVSASCPPLILA